MNECCHRRRTMKTNIPPSTPQADKQKLSKKPYARVGTHNNTSNVTLFMTRSLKVASIVSLGARHRRPATCVVNMGPGPVLPKKKVVKPECQTWILLCHDPRSKMQPSSETSYLNKTCYTIELKRVICTSWSKFSEIRRSPYSSEWNLSVSLLRTSSEPEKVCNLQLKTRTNVRSELVDILHVRRARIGKRHYHNG